MEQKKFGNKICIELVKLVYKQIHFAITAEFFAAIGLVVAMWHDGNHSRLIAWLAFITLFNTIPRTILVYSFKKSTLDAELTYEKAIFWLRLFTTGVVLSGISWGAVAIFLMPLSDPIGEIFLIILVLGVTAAANPYYAPFSDVYVAFLVTAFGPMGVWMLLQGGVFFTLGFLSAVYIIIMYATAKYSQTLISTSLSLNFENSDLVQDLSNAMTTLERRSQDLEKSFATLKATLESTTDGILAIDENDNIITFNQKFLDMWKIPLSLTKEPNAEMKITHYVSHQLIEPEKFVEKAQELYHNPQSESTDELRFKDGRIIERYSLPQLLGDRCVGRVWTFKDVTGRRLLENQLYMQANYDVLTSLPNRALVLDRIGKAISHAKRYKTIIAIMFLDLDRFKIINDTLGHSYGDKLLQIVSNRLSKCVRENDTVSREGGDEFLIILNNLEHEEDVAKIARKCLDAVNMPIEVEGHKLNTTISIGVSLFPRDGHDTETLIRHADLAMYRSKELGGNTFQFFTEEMNRRVQNRALLETRLRSALDNEELFLQYQPIIDLKTYRIAAVEALLRWKNPKHGLVMPAEFISIAEECGFIIPMGNWIIKTACAQVKKWQESGMPDLKLSVNISLRQLLQDGFFENIKDILDMVNFNPKLLALELTESVIMENVEKNIAILNQLKELGVMIMIDDFGTGYSSLSYLKQLPVNRLKIDKTFINDIPHNQDDCAITAAIIAIAEQLNIKVIAEGVINKEQMEFLLRHHCDEAQGYYFSMPLTPEEFERRLKENNIVPP